jgi:hypothetical protein
MSVFLTWLLLLINIVGCAFAAWTHNFPLMISDIVVILCCIEIIDLRTRVNELSAKK